MGVNRISTSRGTEWWDQWFLGMAKYAATASKDPSTKVGAVLVDAQRRVIGLGYNGFPRGVSDLDERLNDRPTKLAMIVHAEVNAILNSAADTRGATLYIWPAFAVPNICNECTKVAIQAGISRVVGPTPPEQENERWAESIKISRTMLTEAGVQIDSVEMLS